MNGPQTLAAQVGAILRDRQLRVATAESCTGGLIASYLTDVSGSSAYMLGGIVAYSNEAKMQFLNVQESTLVAVGAVSEQVAHEMAHGALAAFGADLALSVTGIAGPSGGTPEKPVGLTYIGLAAAQDTLVARFVWPHDRYGNKVASAEAALQMVLEHLS
ncbi:MAG: CinA family protein [Anaerolineales bacterium]